MKSSRMTAIILILFSSASLAYADSTGNTGEMSGKEMEGMSTLQTMNGKMNAQVHHATGVVTKVDTAAGRITLSHDAIRTLSWPAMTMGFPVKDRKLLQGVSVGEKVDFDLTSSGKDQFIIVRINPVHG